MTYPRPDFCPECGHHYAKLFVDGSILCSGCGDDRRSAQRRQDDGWISVEDRRPQSSGWYLVVQELNGVKYRWVRQYCDYWRGWQNIKEEKYGPVTGWMPIPKPPGEDQ